MLNLWCSGLFLIFISSSVKIFLLISLMGYHLQLFLKNIYCKLSTYIYYIFDSKTYNNI